MIKITSPKKFTETIDTLVSEKRLTYIDAVVHYCDENNVEVKIVSKLISATLKEKIEIEARKLNFLKKEIKK